jgi:hypothetical protein
VTEPDVATDAALREQATPPFWARLTMPVNPLTAATLTVEVPGEPALTVTLTGPAAIVKSTKWNETAAVV